MLTLTLALGFCALAGSFVQPSPASVRVLLLIPAGQTRQLEALGFDAQTHRGSAQFDVADVILPEADLPRLRAAFPHAPLRVAERSRPYREIAALRAAAGPDAPDPEYRTAAEVLAALQQLEQQYPTLCKSYDLQSRYGAPFTHEGRRIWVLRISDNPGVDEDEPDALVFANNHSRELNSIEVPLHAAALLLAGYATDPALRALVDAQQVWILPTMNPDGLEFVWSTNNMWRKNRRDNGGGVYGVDLNRNYPFFWGMCGSSAMPTSDSYHGPAATSEPETRAMLAFAQAEVFERLIDFHSHAREVRSPFNPLVRSNVPPAIASYFQAVHQATAAGMTYAPTTTCCCGTHMEWHNTTYGTLAFLVEMGTAFQPPWAETTAELGRLWPGLRGFLLEPIPVRGHVRSVAGGIALAADIEVAGQAFRDGQRLAGGGAFGAYSLCLAPGSYDVIFRAVGHVAKTTRLTVTAGQTLIHDVSLLPVMAPTTLGVSGTGQLGTAVTFPVSSPDDAGAGFFVPCALSGSPTIPIGARALPLAAPLLVELQLGAPSVFVNFLGTLDGSGGATATLHVPILAPLVGLELWFAAVTFADGWPLGVKGISANVSVRLRA